MFEAQVRLAMAHELPLIVHSVRANDTVARSCGASPATGGHSRLQRLPASGGGVLATGFQAGDRGSSAMSGPTRPGRRYARCRWRPCCWKPTLPTCRCKASRGGEHAGQPADHSPLVGTIAAATAGGCYFGVT